MALSADRQIKRRDGVNYSDPVAANTRIFLGALVVLNAAGNAAPGSAATGLKARGVALDQVDNLTGAAGDKRVETRTGVFPFKNSSSADLIARADIGADCYIVDDETVAKTSASNTRSIAGKIVDIDSAGVWVKIG
ncbi:MAG TPA: hypothetical protein VL995_10260 [Cellvibrio sp.]|nr:hypothetical protein [Cellvibrio sp.]